jgi:hypothetical protein
VVHHTSLRLVHPRTCARSAVAFLTRRRPLRDLDKPLDGASSSAAGSRKDRFVDERLEGCGAEPAPLAFAASGGDF